MTQHSTPHHPSLRRRGYTLIELLITIAVMGLAAAIVVPQFSGTDSMRVQAAVRNIIADITFAQADALAHQEYRRVHFYDDGSGYAIVRVTNADYAAAWDDDTADYIFDPLATGASAGQYIVDLTADDRFEGVVITDVDIDNGGADIVFDPMGGSIMSGDVPGVGGSIDLEAGDNSYTISIAPFTAYLTVVKTSG